MARSCGLSMIAFVFMMVLLRVSFAQQIAPSPASEGPAAATSDGSTIDQGIAYALLLFALAVTYLVH